MKFILKIILIITCLGISLAIPEKAQAQRKVQVITKTVTQQLDQVLDSGLVVEGLKAGVEVTGWNKNYIKVEIDLVAKHPNIDVAIEEVTYIQYAISKTKTRYILRNSFESEAGKPKIRSSLSVQYRIFVPVNTSVTVKDMYGDVKFQNLFGSVNLDVEFCDVQFERLFGKVVARAGYSDIRGKDFSADFLLKSKKTDISLEDFAGQVTLDNNYGDISLSPSAMLQSLTVSSRNGKVDLQVNSLEAFNYDVQVNESYIDLPSTESKYVTSQNAGKNFLFQKENGLHKANIKITNQLYPIKIFAYNVNR